MIDKIIKFFVTLKWKREQFYTFSWGIDENTDIHIMTEESYPNRHRFGLKEETFKAESEEQTE